MVREHESLSSVVDEVYSMLPVAFIEIVLPTFA
jgi:hypothetical protein